MISVASVGLAAGLTGAHYGHGRPTSALLPLSSAASISGLLIGGLAAMILTAALYLWLISPPRMVSIGTCLALVIVGIGMAIASGGAIDRTLLGTVVSNWYLAPLGVGLAMIGWMLWRFPSRVVKERFPPLVRGLVPITTIIGGVVLIWSSFGQSYIYL